MHYIKYWSLIGGSVHNVLQCVLRVYLQLIICQRKGTTTFADLRTMNGVHYTTFKEAAVAEFLENDFE